jgi:hypothetical protein
MNMMTQKSNPKKRCCDDDDDDDDNDNGDNGRNSDLNPPTVAPAPAPVAT